MNYPNNKIKSDIKAIAEASEFSPHLNKRQHLGEGEGFIESK